MRVDVEFLLAGQKLQHRLQAAEPQQHARFAAQQVAEMPPKTAPILLQYTSVTKSVPRLFAIETFQRKRILFRTTFAIHTHSGQLELRCLNV